MGQFGNKKLVLKSETLNLFQNSSVNSLSLPFLSLQWEFSVHPCISIKFCCLIAFPPHPLAYYFIEVLLEVQVGMEAARGNPSLPAFNESTSKVTRLEMSL